MKPAAPVSTPGFARPAPARTRRARLVDRLLTPFVVPALLFGAITAFLAARLTAVLGVDVQTGARPGVSERTRPLGTTYFVVTQAERGTTTGVEVIRSMAEYDEKLGDRVTYGAGFDDLETAFNEGLDRAVVARVAGPAATRGTLTLDSDGLGDPTIVLTARDVGDYSTRLDAQVAAGALANTFRIYLYFDDELVEEFMELASPADAVTQINARSRWVTAANSGNVEAAPDNNPAVVAATAFSAGSDDRASIVAGTYTAALARFTPDLGPGIVAIPGQTSANVGAAIAAHNRAHRRIGAVSVAAGSSVAQVKAAADALRATAGAESLGMFYRHVRVPDGAGGTRLISPEGYVAGVRARTIRTYGAWRAPAGEVAIARWVVGVGNGTTEVELTKAEVDDLALSRVNAIRTIAGSTRLYGWRSLSVDETNYKMLTGRDLLNVIAWQAEEVMEPFAFRNVDGRGHMLADMANALGNLVDPIRAAGGLYERVDDATGRELDPGYVVDTGPGVNTDETLAAGQVKANLSVRMSPTAELVTITVTKVALDVAL